MEAESLQETVLAVQDVSGVPATGAGASANGGGVSWEEEWTLLRRRLLFPEGFPASPPEVASTAGGRTWLLRAAAGLFLVSLAFSAGYIWRGDLPEGTGPGEDLRAGSSSRVIAPPVRGASGGNYFDNLDDFTRDTHNFLRRTRMLLMEFTNLGQDSDPTFFSVASGSLLAEVDGYREVAARMQNRKLSELLDQIGGILRAMSSVTPENKARVVADIRATLDLTGLVATLEILHAAVEREMEGQPNV